MEKVGCDVEHIVLLPGNQGKDCPGNGSHFWENGEQIECCCDECNYWFCCNDDKCLERCGECALPCPRRR